MSALKWIKSSYSEASGNNCVEVAWMQIGVALRDSKRPATVFVTGRASFGALIESLRSGSLGSGH
ncbi:MULTISPECIES: DUF397 domain-containing protein [Streptomyces]|uniref:DUF397 domain-containing protein n=1 Tax=Streptomyces prasinus TaxID=67345 RepID=A0ABX6B8K3_9ACTN|nr:MULTISPECIES: DUF397 domain-containing protein [Streptomyces]MCP3767162.1 DUF397 domain-containing protein [Streptomyces sp. MAR25Y5]QEV10491.1 DUF397 domain-containing protein [Streptomyces prasinus]